MAFGGMTSLSRKVEIDYQIKIDIMVSQNATPSLMKVICLEVR
jgi:hypothetical protein